ncbi:MAG TPA: general stress protein [Jiangellaceae bacterium]|nr:general stress protein [Jiangellaceae bacterium]
MASTVPGLPTGLPVGHYETYEQAQRAVDYLSDQEFPVEHLAIVGTDLRKVERVTGRLTWAKVAGSSVVTGLWLGLFVGLVLALFAGPAGGVLGTIVLTAVWGAIFMLILGLVGYALTGRNRDFTSQSAIIAAQYDVLCQHQHAEDARNHLAQFDLQG